MSKKITATKRRLLITRSCGKKYDKVNRNTSAAAKIKNLVER